MKVAGSMIKFVKHKPDMQSGVLSGLASGWIQYTFLTGILQWRHNEHDGSQITGVSIICSPVCSGADQRKHQSSASLAFGRGIDRWPVDSLTKGQLCRRCFHLMTSSWSFVFTSFWYTQIGIKSTRTGYSPVFEYLPVFFIKAHIPWRWQCAKSPTYFIIFPAHSTDVYWVKAISLIELLSKK